MNKNKSREYLSKDEVNDMIESAIRRHNRRSTIISSVLGWILIGGYSFGLFLFRTFKIYTNKYCSFNGKLI